jgi:hypothetical protein
MANRHDPSADRRATAVVVPVGEIPVPSGNIASRSQSTMIRAVSPPIRVHQRDDGVGVPRVERVPVREREAGRRTDSCGSQTATRHRDPFVMAP